MAFLEVQEISKQQGGKTVLHPVSFSLEQGKKLAIAGATGSGKTTLLKIIGGLVQPDGGQVQLEGRRVPGPDEKLLPGHPAIGYLSQHFELRNNYTVGEELDYANELTPEEAAALYQMCDIGHLVNRETNQVSGGEKQRIVTARMLSTRPRLLLLDEPFSNLDMEHRRVMKGIIQAISSQMNLACILVSHEPMDTLPWADEILVLQEGKLVQHGSPWQVYHQPANTYVAGLFGHYDLVPGTAAASLGYSPPQNGKQLLVRPGYITVAPENSGGLPASVQEVQFLGTHCLLTVAVAGQTLQMVHTEPGTKPGDVLRVQLAVPGSWWL